MCWAITSYFLWIIITNHDETETRYFLSIVHTPGIIFEGFCGFEQNKFLDLFSANGLGATLIIIAWSHTWNMATQNTLISEFQIIYIIRKQAGIIFKQNNQDVLSLE